MRTVWFLAGTAAGVYGTAKARRVAEAFSYDGVHDRLTGWFAGARVVRAELQAGIAEKGTELRERLAVEGALDAGTVRALPTGAPYHAAVRADQAGAGASPIAGSHTRQSSTDASRKRDH